MKHLKHVLLLTLVLCLCLPLVAACGAKVAKMSGRGFGFSGGTILGSGLVLFACAFGFDKLRAFMNHRTYSVVRTFGLMLYAVLYGINIFLGANGLPNYLVGMSLLIDLAVGLVGACTVYGFYALFARGEL